MDAAKPSSLRTLLLAGLGLLADCASSRPAAAIGRQAGSSDYGREERLLGKGWDRDCQDEFEVRAGAGFLAELAEQQPRTPFPGSEGFGSVNRWGYGTEVAWHHQLGDERDAPLWIGARFGSWNFLDRRGFDVVLPSGERVDDPVHAEVFFATLSLRANQRIGSRLEGLAGVGAGYYSLTLFEEDDRGDHWRNFDRIADDGAFGGSVLYGLGIRGGWASYRLLHELHFVHFDHLDRYSPGDDTLSGPLQTLSLGVAGRF